MALAVVTVLEWKSPEANELEDGKRGAAETEKAKCEQRQGSSQGLSKTEG